MKAHLIVSGRVQGVGFRWRCKEEADRLGLDGWVRNRSDGTVEVVIEGDDAAVASLVRWCHEGPRHALVSRVEVVDARVADPGPGFVVAY